MKVKELKQEVGFETLLFLMRVLRTISDKNKNDNPSQLVQDAMVLNLNLALLLSSRSAAKGSKPYE